MVLMTATPTKNKCDDIIDILNYLRLNNDKSN